MMTGFNRFQLWRARHLGSFTYHGLFGHQPRWWPHAQVRYRDGKVSVAMALGNAVDYAFLFGGEVIQPTPSAHPGPETEKE